MRLEKRVKGVFVFLCVLAIAILMGALPLQADAAKQGGILNIAIGMNPSRMDPPNSYAGSDMMIGAHIFERLVYFEYDEKAESIIPKPWLAKTWEVSADGKMWTFHLKEGVTFHDGIPFNAEAVKFNIERTIDSEKKTRYGGDLRAVVAAVEVVDGMTIRIHCKFPVAAFLHLIGQPCLGIMSPASVAEHGDKIGRNPTGTGPFKFAKWVSGEFVELAVNRQYWKRRAHLDGIVFRFVPDSSARVNMLQTGEVDVAYNVPVPDHARLRKSGKFDVISWPTATILRLMLNCQKTATKDLKVRQAIKLAIDRPGIIEGVLRGNAKASRSAVAPYSWGYYPASDVTYDPGKAKSLLAEAGWIDSDNDGIREKGGKKLTLTIRAPQAGRYPMDRECLLAIQENLRSVGFECKINTMEFAAFLGSLFVPLEKSNGDAVFVSWSSRTHAWFATYKTLPSKFWVPRGINVSYYKNEEVDKMLDAAVVERNEQKAMAFYKRVQILTEEEVPQIQLWLMNYMIAKKKNVHNVTTVPLPTPDTFNVREAWIE